MTVARTPALVLIDGEHYPPVVRDALQQGGERYEFLAALFLGGAEKIERAGLKEGAEKLYGLPVMFADDYPAGWAAGLDAAIERYRPGVVVDLSDEPVLGYTQRFRLASTSLGPRGRIRRLRFPLQPRDFQASLRTFPRSPSSVPVSGLARPQ